MGGAMDLVAGARRIVVTMEHVAKTGEHKVLAECTLPITGRKVVHRVITDMAVMDVLPNGQGLKVLEMASGVTPEDLKAKTSAKLVFA